MKMMRFRLSVPTSIGSNSISPTNISGDCCLTLVGSWGDSNKTPESVLDEYFAAAKAVWSRFNTLRGDFGLQDRLMRTIAAAQSSMTRSSVLFSIFCSRLIKLQARLLMLLLKVAVEVTGLKTPLEDTDVMEEVGASHEALARDDDDPPCSSS